MTEHGWAACPACGGHEESRGGARDDHADATGRRIGRRGIA